MFDTENRVSRYTNDIKESALVSDNLRTRAMMAAEYYHSNIRSNSTKESPQSEFRKSMKNIQRSSIRMNGGSPAAQHSDPLRAGVTASSEQAHRLMKQAQEYRNSLKYSSDYRAGSAEPMRPVSNGNSFEGKRYQQNSLRNGPEEHPIGKSRGSPTYRYSGPQGPQPRGMALTTDNVNTYNKVNRPEYPIRRSNSNSTINDTMDNKKSPGGYFQDTPLRREYGSTSSIDIQSVSGESFFQMLKGYKAESDQRSPAPPHIDKLLTGSKGNKDQTQEQRRSVVAEAAVSNYASGDQDQTDATTKDSPKLARKNTKKDKAKSNRSKAIARDSSLFRKLRGGKDDRGIDRETESRLVEERYRQKAFSHYDCQSLMFDFEQTLKNRNQVTQRNNITTGASAASRPNNSATPQGSKEDVSDEADLGDGKSNDLVLSCAFFRNEIGKDEEDRVLKSADYGFASFSGLKEAVLEGKQTAVNIAHRDRTSWIGGAGTDGASSTSNNARLRPANQPVMERVDYGALYYRQYFCAQEHQNYFGMDDNLGPIAVSSKRESFEEGSNYKDGNAPLYQYRVIIRTSQLTTLRGSILEDAIPSTSRHGSSRGLPPKDIIEYVAPQIQLSCLKLAHNTEKVSDQLLKLDEQGLTNKYKVGIMYCRAGQQTEEEMYSNEFSGPFFDEFLDLIGQRVRLKDFDKYKAGLDVKSDSTGTHSVYTIYQDCEVMFHVSTLLPYTPNNQQQLLRKRHIGNDIVTIVFQEPGALPFTPKTIRSHFQHVFIVVRAHYPNAEDTYYSVAVARSKEVPAFGPPLPENATFLKSKAFVDFLLAKVINAENAAHKSEKFIAMATRTRQEYLQDLAHNHVTSTSLESGAKFGKFSLWDKKKEKTHSKIDLESTIRGAMAWKVKVEDVSHNQCVDCVLGISADTLVLIDINSKEPIFSTPCKSLIGWTSEPYSLKIFYMEGKCLMLHSAKEGLDEVPDIAARLTALSDGCETSEIILRRNSLGQLGFHVHYQGIVTDVEQYGFAWQAGLRKGSRIVEICKVPVYTLNTETMVQLLKTSPNVTVVVIPPYEDGLPRRGLNALENTVFSDSAGRDFVRPHGVRGISKGAYANEKVSPTSSGNRPFPSKAAATTNPPPPLPDYSARRDGATLPPPYADVRSVARNLEHQFNSPAAPAGREQPYEQQRGLGSEDARSDTRSNRSQHSSEGQRSHHSSLEGEPSSGIGSLESRLSSDANLMRNSVSRRSGRGASGRGASNHQYVDPSANRHRHLARQEKTPVKDKNETTWHQMNKAYQDARRTELPSYKATPVNLTHSSSSDNESSSDSSEHKWYDTGDDLVESIYYRKDPSEHNDGGYGSSSYLNLPKSTIPGSTTVRTKTVSPDRYHHMQEPKVLAYTSERQQQQPSAVTTAQTIAVTDYAQSSSNISDHSSHSTSSHSSSVKYVSHREVGGTQSPLLTRHPMRSSIRNASAGAAKVRTLGTPQKKQPAKLKYGNVDVKGGGTPSDSVTSCLRPGVTSHSHSKSLSGTVQENLLKLISPDPDITNGLDSKPNKRPVSMEVSSPYVVKTMQRTLSEESINGLASSKPKKNSDVPADVVFTNTKISSLPTRMIPQTTNIIDEKLSSPNSLFPLPDVTSDLDWSNLVKTAKQFEGLDFNDELAIGGARAFYSTASQHHSDIEARKEKLETELDTIANQLEKEQTRRVELESEMNRLKQDNVRLQEESQTAASQLRKFTEWFFNTIERQ